MSDTFEVIDLFSGCGGLSVGFEAAGFKVLAGVDHDETALLTHEANLPNADALHKDLSQASVIREICNAYPSANVIVAGPPCQGFSLTGPRRLDDERNSLYMAVYHAVAELQPMGFVIENVPGLARMYGGKILADIVHKFSAGLPVRYDVQHKILLAADYGVPQMRQRLFIVGVRKDLGRFAFPQPSHSPGDYVGCADALDDLPSREDDLGAEIDKYEVPPRTDYQRMMRGDQEVLFNHVAANHTEKVKSVISLVPEGGNYKDLPPGVGEHRRFNEAWTRYHSQKPSRTIDTGHRNHFHYKWNRVPTVRENARLQSFPDRFRFLGSKTMQNRQVGNAVPPLMARAVAESLLFALKGEHALASVAQPTLFHSELA